MKALVVGMGRMGSSFDMISEKKWVNTHLGAYKHNSLIKKIAICDKSEKALNEAASFWSIKDLFTNVEEALELFSPDICSICCNAQQNLALIRNIIKCKSVKLLWVEKPFSDTVEHALEQLKLLSHAKIHFVTNYQRRFDGFYVYIKDRLDDMVGNIQKCTAYFSGGIVNSGSHLVNLLLFYFGLPCKVFPLKLEAKAMEFDYHGDFCLDYDNFNVYCFELNKQTSILSKGYSIFEIQIWGEKGRLDIKSMPYNEYAFTYYAVGSLKFKNVSVLKEERLKLNFKRTYMHEELKFLLSKIHNSRSIDTEGAVDTLKILKEIGALG